jgi:hypothetical protein
MISIHETNETIIGSSAQDWEETWLDHWTLLNNTDNSTFTAGSSGSGGGGILSDLITIIGAAVSSAVELIVLVVFCIGGLSVRSREDIVSQESRKIITKDDNKKKMNDDDRKNAINHNSHHHTVTKSLITVLIMAGFVQCCTCDLEGSTILPNSD